MKKSSLTIPSISVAPTSPPTAPPPPPRSPLSLYLLSLLHSGSAFWPCVCRPPSSMVSKNSGLGTYSFRSWNAALLLEAGFTAPKSLRTPSLKADGLSTPQPSQPLHECWNRHATNTSEVRLASVGGTHEFYSCRPYIWKLAVLLHLPSALNPAYPIPGTLNPVNPTP